MLTVRNLPPEPTVVDWLRANRATVALCAAWAVALLGLSAIADGEAIGEFYRAVSVTP